VAWWHTRDHFTPRHLFAPQRGRFSGYSAVSRIARKRLGQNSTLTPVLATPLPAIQGSPKRLKKARECNVQRKTLSRPANPRRPPQDSASSGNLTPRLCRNFASGSPYRTSSVLDPVISRTSSGFGQSRQQSERALTTYTYCRHWAHRQWITSW